MQKAANKNLVLTRFSSCSRLGGTYQAIGQEELYQQVVSALTKGVYEKQISTLVNQLVMVADHSFAMRDVFAAEQVSEILVNAPLPPEYHVIGQYYKVMCVFHRGNYATARTMLERLAESEAAPLKYRARALEAIGAAYFYTNNHAEALRFLLQAGYAASPKHGRDLLTATLSQWMIAVIKSIKGDNGGALEDLERLSSPIRLLAADQPFIFYSYSNSLAVEMGELGRIKEAQHASRIALASPFAQAHPEWRETANDNAQKARRPSRSVVSIPTARPEPEPVIPDVVDQSGDESSLPEPPQDSRPPSVILFPHRLRDVPGAVKPGAITTGELNQLTMSQKRSMVLTVAYDQQTPGQDYDRMLEAVGLVVDETGPKELDLESESNLETLMLKWCHLLDPEEFTAVMSALRDCEDSFRRNELIDRMICYAFRQTSKHSESESEWRARVEARLKSQPGRD